MCTCIILANGDARQRNAQMASASNSITTLSVEKNEQDVAVLQKIIATQSDQEYNDQWESEW